MGSQTLPLAPSRLDPLLRPIGAFLAAESAGGILLIVSAVAALVWANSPWGDSYEHFWHVEVGFRLGGKLYAMSLEHWVNDGLMVVFFLLVGLEIKRELLIGELTSVRQASLPVAAAIGGMVVPALIYAALNHGRAGVAGWGVPMATDIAFAAGVLTLFGRGLPLSVKVLLLAVAIVDDLGAVLVIALFYTNQVSIVALAAAGGLFAALVLLNVLRVHGTLPYVILGVGLWIATLFSGIHATIAGVLLAFTIPATRQIEEGPYVESVRRMLEDFERDATAVPDKITGDQSHALHVIEAASSAVQTPLARLEHALLKPVNFVIVPLFALANAGVSLRSTGVSRGGMVMWGVLLGLVLGKPLGILAASWAAVKSGVAVLPEGGTWQHVFGLSILCGIGFTMSLFVANLAFGENQELLGAAKVGILAASLVAAVAGSILLARARAR
ncbi:MAG TPA: Na+/H+ antiporter NhaA [Tepidisphaeraceae bacterium]|jgi:NhaA family Na+:H+ antiporter|nr:Na+/H+ antiporter NhaA [Tepidisphaeraceae bacterium]